MHPINRAMLSLYMELRAHLAKHLPRAALGMAQSIVGRGVWTSPAFFVKKDAAAVDGVAWSVDTLGSPEWACEIVTAETMDHMDLAELLSQYEQLGVREVT